MRGQRATFSRSRARPRYHCPQSRTLFFRPPPIIKRAETAVSGRAGTRDWACHSRQPLRDIANAFKRLLNKSGSKRTAAAAFIGRSYPPTGGDATCRSGCGDMTIEIRMVFIMPALWLEDGGLEITEAILITIRARGIMQPHPARYGQGTDGVAITPTIHARQNAGKHHGHLRLRHSRDWTSAWGSVMSITVVQARQGRQPFTG